MITLGDRGTEWRKWDLHVHTPSSIRQRYGGDSEENWVRYIDELERLPPEFSVIGVNDYWFLDGYCRLRAARDAGRLSNLAAIFPVVELRLEQFGGTDSHLSRANLHVIFDPDLKPEVIREQFISAMTSKFRLTSEGEAAGSWSGVVSRQSLEDLGRAIKASVPANVVDTLGSDIEAGFNNLVVTLDSVKQALSTTYFRNRALLALGKTEWADIKWQEGAIASKKHLVNSAEFLFTAFEDPASWPSQRAKLADANVNDRLLDCSDAHAWSDADVKDRIGNCATWVRAAPSFGGLLHALAEFDGRVYVGAEPEDLMRLRTSPERIIDTITVTPRDDSGLLFDYSLPLNPGLVAVIGNKGQGKSALLDCVARAGNSSRGEDFAFLNQKRFLHPRTGQGARYSAKVRWMDGRERSATLNESYQPSIAESVEYLPQELIERICNSDPVSEHRDSFEAELKRVMFHHIPRTEREGQVDLDSLLRLRTRSVSVALGALRDQILQLITELIELENRGRSLVPGDLRSRLEVLERARESVEAELAAAKDNLAMSTGVPQQEDPALVADRARLAELEAQVVEGRTRDASDEQVAADARRRLTELDSARAEVEVLATRASGLNVQIQGLTGVDETYITLVTDVDNLDLHTRELRSRAEMRQAAIDGRTAEMDSVRAQMAEITSRLEVADSAREALRRQVVQLETRLRQIIGQDDDPETIAGLETLLDEADSIPSDLQRVRSDALAATRHAHELLLSQVDVIRTLYRPAAKFVSEEPLASEASVQFEAELAISGTWATFTNALDGRRTSELATYLTGQHNALNSENTNDVVDMVSAVLDRLGRERGGADGPATRPLASAYRSAVDVAQILSDFLALKWLEPRFGLTGSGMPLVQLSPGQRGLILLLFYLLVDRSESPLLIDQPEENLDNDAVRRLLVPALKKARSRRQIIVVTHNANLAIVGDADQIVACTAQDDRFVIQAGSLAGHETGEITINVLEGSRAAFANRRDKYDRVVGSQPT